MLGAYMEPEGKNGLTHACSCCLQSSKYYIFVHYSIEEVIEGLGFGVPNHRKESVGVSPQEATVEFEENVPCCMYPRDGSRF